jgi:hypothetical protein
MGTTAERDRHRALPSFVYFAYFEVTISAPLRLRGLTNPRNPRFKIDRG